MGLHSLGYLIREGIKGLFKHRTMTIASIAVLVSCLLLTGVAGLITLSLSATMDSVEGRNTITVFLEDGLPALEAVRVGEDLRQLNNITSCTFVPKDDGLIATLQQMGGDAELFSSLVGTDNPLPDSYNITLSDLSLYDDTVAAVEQVEGVSEISDFSDYANKLSNLDRLVRYSSIAVVAVLGVVSLFIISNTVKVTVFSRRVEISIMKSVGATNGFVRLPFLIEGVSIGVISGLISATILYFSYEKAIEVIYSIVSFFVMVDIRPYVVLLYAIYIVVGMLFGMLGGVISIGKYLKKEGEDIVV